MPKIGRFKISWSSVLLPLLMLVNILMFLLVYYLIYFRDGILVIEWEEIKKLTEVFIMLMIFSLIPLFVDIQMYFEFDRKGKNPK